MTRFLLFLCLTLATWASPLPDKAGPRAGNLQRLSALGFRVSPSLPQTGRQVLRPREEICRRALALHAVALWVAAPRDMWSDKQVRDYVAWKNLNGAMTAEERAILNLSRQQAKLQELDQIGWKLENLWGLAWVMGFDLEPGVQGQFAGAELRRLVFEFLPGPSRNSQEAFWSRNNLRPLPEIIRLEDFLYCAHNAVRSAQLGKSTVPDDFDPVSQGGAVHERRHALTWCLSPGVSWEETDLST